MGVPEPLDRRAGTTCVPSGRVGVTSPPVAASYSCTRHIGPAKWSGTVRALVAGPGRAGAVGGFVQGKHCLTPHVQAPGLSTKPLGTHLSIRVVVILPLVRCSGACRCYRVTQAGEGGKSVPCHSSFQECGLNLVGYRWQGGAEDPSRR